jgi:hypothetical protein
MVAFLLPNISINQLIRCAATNYFFNAEKKQVSSVGSKAFLF